jgi:hypothetical protein
MNPPTEEKLENYNLRGIFVLSKLPYLQNTGVSTFSAAPVASS